MSTRKSIKIIYLLLLLFASASMTRAQCVPASTAAGAPDTCFGTGGRVTTEITTQRDFSRALAFQSDGKIVVAGIAGFSLNYPNDHDPNFVVVRYNTDGTLDTTWDNDGIKQIDFGPGLLDDDYCRGLAIQPDGKIVVAGRSFVTPSTYAFAMVRMNTDGSFDSTFDGDGRAQFELAAIIEQYGMILLPDGKFLVAGRSFVGGAFSGLLVRFNSDGSIDNSFGTSGNGSTTAGITSIFSISRQPDGKIVAGGTQGADATASFALARLNADGTPDMSFGNNGIVLHHPTITDQTWFVRVRFDGQIFLGGHSAATQGDARGTLLRFGSSGALGDDVIYQTENAFWNMAFQPDGKPLAIGLSHSPASGFTIRRFFDIDVPDPTFNGGAAYVKFLPAQIPESSGVNAIAMTRDNKIVAVGSVTEADNQHAFRLAITRMFSGLQAPHPERFDFDGDGKADVSIFRPSNGQWWVNTSSNGGNFAATFGVGTDIIAPGDYTGDGKTDIGFWRPSTGEWFGLRSEDFSYFAAPFGTNGDIPRPSDWDGDGKTDFIVYRPSTNVWYRINSLGITSFLQFGSSGDKPVTGDFDGDGKTDVAIYRPLTGTWWWQSSLTGVQNATQWGLSTDTPVPGDYDADGKTDLAVYRASSGTWYIMNSTNGSFTITNFGLSEDRPVPADYDGDGRADIAVFRPSTGIWYLLRSTAGFTALQFGLSSDIPTPNAFID